MNIETMDAADAAMFYLSALSAGAYWLDAVDQMIKEFGLATAAYATTLLRP